MTKKEETISSLHRAAGNILPQGRQDWLQLKAVPDLLAADTTAEEIQEFVADLTWEISDDWIREIVVQVAKAKVVRDAPRNLHHRKVDWLQSAINYLSRSGMRDDEIVTFLSQELMELIDDDHHEVTSITEDEVSALIPKKKTETVASTS